MKTEQLLQTDSRIQQNIFREISEFSFDITLETIQNILKIMPILYMKHDGKVAKRQLPKNV